MRKGLLLWTLSILAILAAGAFALSPYELGTLRDYRIMVYLKYWHIIKPNIVNPETLSRALTSKDVRVQTDAAQTIGLLDPDPMTIKALRQFLDRRDVDASAKDVAIWSLGELRVHDALGQLKLLVGNADYDQKNLAKAIDRIEGRVGDSIWP